LSEAKKKFSSKISVLKTKLDLCRAEMETERQTHQREEKALRARVIEEEEEQRDAAVEAMKKECMVLRVLFVFFYVLLSPSADLFFDALCSSSS